MMSKPQLPSLLPMASRARSDCSTRSCSSFVSAMPSDKEENASIMRLPSLRRTPGLLRVVSPSRLLRGFAEVFRTNADWKQVGYTPSHLMAPSYHSPLLLAEEGTPQDQHAAADEVYSSSEPAEEVSAFISHVWASPRWRKFLALCFYLNATLAVTLATFTWIFMMLVTTLVLGPFGMGGKWYLVLLFVYIPISVFFIVFFWGHLLHTSVKDMWLDKLCIHQTRDDLKEKGVQALPEIVVLSNRMIILWDTQYFERLWCCAEVAIFCSTKGGADNVDFVPLWIAPWVLSSMVTGLLSISISERLFSLIGSIGVYLENHFEFIPKDFVPLLSQFGGISAGFFVGSLPAVGFSYYALRSKMRNHRKMLHTFATFKVQNTKCKVENDRALVMDLLAKLYRDAVDPSEAFNRFVRKDLPCHVEKNVGRVKKIRYKLCLLIVLPLAFSSTANILGCDGISCDVAAVEELGPGAQPWQQMSANCSAWLIGSFLIYPTTYPVMLMLMESCERALGPDKPRKTAALQVLSIIASYAYMGILEGIAAGLLNSTSDRIWHNSFSTSLPWCVALSVFLVMLGAWNIYLYWL
eukprot:gb/GFBE01030278.1/.p1 GENE.gb/GFBE01030278.1/~~gb/GFBE01030278.1/.p1  ORF type:complete len:580 (+),score=106.08 gb/GFBE01030278.1/:1-1740(+)